jgi:hypothetical protein
MQFLLSDAYEMPERFVFGLYRARLHLPSSTPSVISIVLEWGVDFNSQNGCFWTCYCSNKVSHFMERHDYAMSGMIVRNIS